MKQRGTYMGRPNFPSDDRAAGDLGREHRLNVKTFSAVVLGDMPAAASSVRAAMRERFRWGSTTDGSGILDCSLARSGIEKFG